MRGLWNHRNSELGSRLGVAHLVRHEWYHAWNDLPRYFKTAAVDLGYNSAEWQNEELGCANAGGGCTQRFLPGEIESDDLIDDRGSACSDSELLLHSPRPCFTTVIRDTIDLLAESCRGYTATDRQLHTVVRADVTLAGECTTYITVRSTFVKSGHRQLGDCR